MNIRTTLTAAFLAVGLALGASAAQAFPVATAAPGVTMAGIQEAAYMCGPGWTRGPYGHCRPKFTCPPGWHSGPMGYHCFRNRGWHRW